MPTWVRGEERASVVSPFPQKMAITALGNSGHGMHTDNGATNTLVGGVNAVLENGASIVPGVVRWTSRQ